MKKYIFAVCIVMLALFPATTETYGNFGEFFYEMTDDKIVILEYTGKETRCVIPQEIEGYPVTTIGSGAFYGKYVKELAIPDSVTTIEESAFYLALLKSIQLPKSVESVHVNAFSGCPNLESITVDKNNVHYKSFDGVLFNKKQTVLHVFPQGRGGSYTVPNGVVEINARAFYEREALQNLIISDSVVKIGEYAFRFCTSLETVQLPRGLREIPHGCFEGCSSLKTIVIPQTVTKIDNNAFYASSLSSVKLPSTITEIGAAAFAFCAIKHIAIPPLVAKLESGVFGNADLVSIEIPPSVTSIADNVFYFDPNVKNLLLMVFCKKDSYAYNWCRDNNITCIDDTFVYDRSSGTINAADTVECGIIGGRADNASETPAAANIEVVYAASIIFLDVKTKDGVHKLRMVLLDDENRNDIATFQRAIRDYYYRLSNAENNLIKNIDEWMPGIKMIVPEMLGGFDGIRNVDISFGIFSTYVSNGFTVEMTDMRHIEGADTSSTIILDKENAKKLYALLLDAARTKAADIYFENKENNR